MVKDEDGAMRGDVNNNICMFAPMLVRVVRIIVCSCVLCVLVCVRACSCSSIPARALVPAYFQENMKLGPCKTLDARPTQDNKR